MSIVMGMPNFIKIYQKVQGIGPVSLFSEFEPRQNLDLSQISFDSLIGYILSISMCMQNFITIFFTVLQIGPFSLLQNLELGKASTDKKCHFAISWARSCQYQYLRKSLSKHSTQFKRKGHFYFFRIWHTEKPRPTINVILQFLGLDLFNIKLSAKFYQNIPNGLIVNFHFFFSEFEPRQNLDQSQMSFDNLMGYILSIYQCVCKISSQYSTQFKRQGHFHFFRIWSTAKPRPMKNDISQSLGLDLDNINNYAEDYQYIPLSSRDKAIFTFSEFGSRQSLDR